MKRIKRKLLVISLILISGIIVLTVVEGRQFYCAVVATYPKAWLTVTPGMSSGEARKFLGQPWADGRGLKSVDRWRMEQNGVEVHLDLWFNDQNDNDKAMIARVVRWKWFMGAEIEKVVDPPWPKHAEQPLSPTLDKGKTVATAEFVFPGSVIFE